MSNTVKDRLQRELAPIFLLLVAAVPVAVALLWGRLRGQEAKGPAPTPPVLAPLTEARVPARPLRLEEADRAALMRMLWDSLEALEASEPPPSHETLPDGCLRRTDSMLFVTLYAPGRRALRANARASSLGEATAQVAHRLHEDPAFRGRGFHRLEDLYARFDVVTEEHPLPPPQRAQFAGAPLEAPVGLALWHEGRRFVFLPGDVADYLAHDHLDMLQHLCREAGLPAEAWRERKHYITVLRTHSFVNVSAGGTYCVSLVRGLPHVREVGLAQARRSCRLAAAYLVRSQQDDGRFVGLLDAGTGATWGPAGLDSQARATGALARFCSRRQKPPQDYLEACRRAGWALLSEIRVPGEEASIAFVPVNGDGGASLMGTARVLSALCAVHRAGGGEQWEKAIERLTNFLVLLQQEDGGFSPGQEGKEPPSAAAQLEAAVALLGASEVLNRPRLLVRARRVLELLSGKEEALQEPEARRRFVVACAKLSTIDKPDVCLSAARGPIEEVAQDRLSIQFSPASDLTGGSLRQCPPLVGETAADLEALANGWLLELMARGDGETGPTRTAEAARDAARYVVQFQFLPENTYYLVDPSRALGGFRRQPGSNAISPEEVGVALDGLNILTQAMMLEPR